MKSKILVQNRLKLLFVLLIIALGRLPVAADTGYALVASSGSNVYVYSDLFQEVLFYQGQINQLTINSDFNATSDFPQNSRIVKVVLPFAWRLTADGRFLFGVNPGGEGIIRVNLSNPTDRNSFNISPEHRLLQVLNEDQWLIVQKKNGMYTIAIYYINSSILKDLYYSRAPIYQAFYDTRTYNLFLFSFEESSEYTDIARQFYRLRRVNNLTIFNVKTNKQSRWPGGYPTYNALAREIVYFSEGQAMRARADGQKPTPLPLNFPPLYTINGDWVSAPQILILPDASFVIWVKNQDGLYQLMNYDKEGNPLKILLNQQVGPVSLQLVKKLPEVFYAGDIE